MLSPRPGDPPPNAPLLTRKRERHQLLSRRAAVAGMACALALIPFALTACGGDTDPSGATTPPDTSSEATISVPGRGEVPASEVIVAHFCPDGDTSACETGFLDAMQVPRDTAPECPPDGYPDPAVGPMCYEPEGVDRIIGSLASDGS